MRRESSAGAAPAVERPVLVWERSGGKPVDAGPLRIARYLEPFTLLIAQLAYETEGGQELAYRFERFGQRRRR